MKKLEAVIRTLNRDMRRGVKHDPAYVQGLKDALHILKTGRIS